MINSEAILAKIQKEPDLVRFVSYGYPCYIMRNQTLSNLLGYLVITTSGHIFYDKEYDEIDVTIHGGLTYSGSIYQYIKEHETNERYKSYDFMIGFDCAHLGDIWFYKDPTQDNKLTCLLSNNGDGYDGDSYKDIEFVKNALVELALQVRQADTTGQDFSYYSTIRDYKVLDSAWQARKILEEIKGKITRYQTLILD